MTDCKVCGRVGSVENDFCTVCGRFDGDPKEYVTEKIVCTYCNSVDIFHLTISGPHLRVNCRICGRYIKFLSKNKQKTLPEVQPDSMNTMSTNTNDTKFAPGIRMFDKHPNAPEFVLASLIIGLDELFSFCQSNPQFLADYQGKKQLKLQILRSQQGAIYASIDTFGTPAHQAPAPVAQQPQQQQQGWGAQPQPQQQQGWGTPPQQPQQQPAAQPGWVNSAAQANLYPTSNEGGLPF